MCILSVNLLEVYKNSLRFTAYNKEESVQRQFLVAKG